MIFEKKNPREAAVNPYDWPDNYYMEMDAAARRKILDERMREHPDGELEKRIALFEQRYAVNRREEYSDHFMEACLDLSYLGSRLNKAFSGRANERMIRKVIRQLCLDQEDAYGTGILYEELCHLIRMYIMISMDDTAYRSVILNVVKMDDAQCRNKLRKDLEVFSQTIPESLGVKEEFSLFRRAVLDTTAEYL